MASPIPETMFAWRKHRESTEPIWEEVPVPEPGPTGVLCKMLAAGVCRSDHYLLHVPIEKQPSWFQDNFTLGHEGCGQVVKLGEQIRNDSHIKVGDIVAMHAVPGCGSAECPECSRDLSQLCELGHHSGIGQDGFYAPYAIVDIRGVVPVPDGVSPAEAAVATDAVTTSYHAIHRRGQVQASELLFLFGLGGLGFNALQVIRNIGARVIIAEVKQDLLDDAAKLGVPPEDLVPIGTAPLDFIREQGLEGKIDTVFDFVGRKQTFHGAQQIVRRGGKIVCIGTLDKENTVYMSLGTRKRLTFIFSYGGQVADLKDVLELIAQGKIQPLVKTRKLHEFPGVLEELGEGKVHGRIALSFD
ncbi:chaperonin 10-like protein [Microdochium trichocladiopsis]|uniref:Chaperonin 10-like protein n=1 Tax=Microdochium trichocladiopsis TaxID=1682393 RepID=A0A9P9BPU2_9PEZI|nr:chaperonin 10-like protein [Microdochium trichocladiopsis]KAH7029592.1 chaperonin 10-like protein [Microdochium trichocladiopsis]